MDIPDIILLKQVVSEEELSGFPVMVSYDVHHVDQQQQRYFIAWTNHLNLYGTPEGSQNKEKQRCVQIGASDIIVFRCCRAFANSHTRQVQPQLTSLFTGTPEANRSSQTYRAISSFNPSTSAVPCNVP